MSAEAKQRCISPSEAEVGVASLIPVAAGSPCPLSRVPPYCEELSRPSCQPELHPTMLSLMPPNLSASQLLSLSALLKALHSSGPLVRNMDGKMLVSLGCSLALPTLALPRGVMDLGAVASRVACH